MSTAPRAELARITLSVLFIGGLIVGAFWILQLFLGSFVWATMIVVATWPLMRRLEAAFGGRRAPAIAVMTLALLAILIVPLVVAIDAVLGQGDQNGYDAPAVSGSGVAVIDERSRTRTADRTRRHLQDKLQRRWGRGLPLIAIPGIKLEPGRL